MLFGNIWTIKLGILRYFLRTFVVLLPRALVITSSPCARLHIAINPSLVRFKNRVPKPYDAFRSVQNIFVLQPECSSINTEDTDSFDTLSSNFSNRRGSRGTVHEVCDLFAISFFFLSTESCYTASTSL